MIVQFAVLCLQVGLSDEEIDKAWVYIADTPTASWTPGTLVRALRSFKEQP